MLQTGMEKRKVVKLQGFVYLPRCICNVFFCFAVLRKSLPNTTNDLVLVLCPRRLSSAAHLCSCSSTAILWQSAVEPFQQTFSTVFHPGCGLVFLQIMSLHISGLSCEHLAWVETAWVLIAALCHSSFYLIEASVAQKIK